jgi:acyl-CoA synthetase (AMP-forming)/AMP-acid ligase II/acyl carrier protein
MTCHVLNRTHDDSNQGLHSTRRSIAIGEAIAGSLLTDDGMVHLLREAADAGPDRGIVFIQHDAEEFLSYSELMRRATIRLGILQREGLQPGATAILVQNHSADFLISFWACILGGIIPAPIAYPSSFTAANDPLSKLHAVWHHLRQPPILSDDAAAAHTGDIERLLGIEGLRILPTSLLDQPHAPGRLLDGSYLERTAFIQFSSGSTGMPKGVTLTHRNLITNMEASICAAEIDERDRMLSWMPYHHDMGIIGFHLTPLAARCLQLNMTPLQFLKNPTLWLAKIDEHRVTMTGSPNFGYQCVLDKVTDDDIACWDLRCVRLIFNGAEPISPDVMRRFQDRLAPAGLASTAMFPVYGMAEASLAVTFPPRGTEPVVHSVNRQRLVSDGVVEVVTEGDQRALRAVDLGSPIPSCAVRIVDAQHRVVPEGRVGHVEIQGGNVTAGYWKNPLENQKAIRDGWLDTGDLGFMLGGRLMITGRAKDIIFVNGQNFFAFDLERCAAEVEGVHERKVAAAGWTDEALGREQVVLFLSTRIPRGSALTRRQIYANVWRHINEQTGVSVDFMVPLQVLPKTTSGKVQRYRLLQDFRDGKYGETAMSRADILGEDGDARQPETRTETEARIGRIWGDVIGRHPESFSVDSSFLAIGGSSLKAVQVLARLETEFTASIPNEILIQCRTVREMARYLDTYLTAIPRLHGRAVHISSPAASVSTSSDWWSA